MKTSDLRRWAIVGAQQRLAEIVNEQGAILAAFPELRSPGRRAEAATVNNGESETPQRKRRRFRMSAEARKRIGDAQRARWANQRANSASKPILAVKSTSRKKK